MPVIAIALVMLECAAPAKIVGISPALRIAHCRAVAIDTRFAAVAPLTKCPRMSAPSPKMPAKACTVFASRSAAIEPMRFDTFWSQALAIQSAASASGVAPPVTKPK